jgi:hypothetical protein
MRRILTLTALLLAISAALPASEFDWMVREFSRQSGAHQLHIPFFGLARFVVAVGHPAGASELNLAVFEHPNMLSDDFSHLADSTVGTAWKPIVRVRSKSGEATNIYAQQDGKHLKLLIATLEKEEAVFVQVRIRPEALIKFVDDQKKHHHA